MILSGFENGLTIYIYNTLNMMFHDKMLSIYAIQRILKPLSLSPPHRQTHLTWVLYAGGYCVEFTYMAGLL